MMRWQHLAVNSWPGRRQQDLLPPETADKGKGKGKGRGGATFFRGGRIEELGVVPPPEDAHAAPATTRFGRAGRGPGRGGEELPERFIRCSAGGGVVAGAPITPVAPLAPRASLEPRRGVCRIWELEAALRRTNLQAYAQAAREWCEAQGVARIREVREFFDDFAGTLGLDTSEKVRLAAALGVSRGASAVAAVTAAPPTSPCAAICEALRRSMRLRDRALLRNALGSAAVHLEHGDKDAYVEQLTSEAESLLQQLDHEVWIVQELEEASAARDTARLRVTLAEVQKFFAPDECNEAVRLLAELEAEGVLAAAIAARDAVAIQDALQQASVAFGEVDIRCTEAKCVLVQLEAERILEEAVASRDVDKLRKALGQASVTLGEEDPKWTTALDILTELEAEHVPSAAVAASDLLRLREALGQSTVALEKGDPLCVRAARVLAHLEATQALPGLADLLSGPKLERFLPQAAAWCEKVGARSLADVAEQGDALAQALQLRPLERKRLLRALAPHCTSVKLLGGLDSVFAEAKLEMHSQHAQVMCHALAYDSLGDVERHANVLGKHLGLRPLELHRLKTALSAAASTTPKPIAAAASDETSTKALDRALRGRGVEVLRSAIDAERVDKYISEPTLVGAALLAADAESKKIVALQVGFDSGSAEALRAVRGKAEPAGLEVCDLRSIDEACVETEDRDAASEDLRVEEASANFKCLFNAVQNVADASFSETAGLAAASSVLATTGRRDKVLATAQTVVRAAVAKAADTAEASNSTQAPSGVVGLEAVLRRAELESHLDRAYKWCEEKGAMNLHEVVELFGDFSWDLGLDEQEQLRLLHLLEGSGPQERGAPTARGESLTEEHEGQSVNQADVAPIAGIGTRSVCLVC